MTMEHDETETEFDTEALALKAIESLPATTDMIYIDRGDELTDKECALIVGGKSDEVMESRDWTDTEEGAVDIYLNDSGLDEDERDALRESDDFDTFREACYDRDDSTPLKDLIRNTGRQLVRFYIRNGKGERIALPYDAWRLSDEEAETHAKRLCKAAGLNWQKNADNFRELVANASGGGVLCIIAYVEMSDVNEWAEFCHRNPERGRVRLSFTNPQVHIHDHINGSGHGVDSNGIVRVRFGLGALDDGNHGAMALDAKNVGTGYSWDETAGPYKPAYKCDPAVYTYVAPKGGKPDTLAPESWPEM